MSSFFNKLVDKLDLGGKEGKERPHNRDYPPSSQQHNQYRQYGEGQSHQSSSPYGYSDSQTQQPYSSPPQQGAYPADGGQYHQQGLSPSLASGLEPVYSPPQDKPPLPSGWIPKWDPHYQRWYYAEEATGRTQWEAPGARSSDYHRGGGSSSAGAYDAHGGGQLGTGSGSGGHEDSYGHGYDDHRSSANHAYHHSGGSHDQYDHGHHKKDKKDKKDKEHKDKKDNTLLYAAGGLAVGAIGGAVIAQALDDSDSDSERHHYGAPPVAAAAYEPAYYAEGDYVDASDRESVASARERYEEAQRAAADSDASSSEEEELEEAREEYEEEYEEAYDD
ncbi:hypothetical protein F5Y17DRAFT_175241 [Xylariaceae sp. FL0594]|nr:hypothetical protein F5Y17DRAFT_175241 [Xylariaceae sp. FL0594]